MGPNETLQLYASLKLHFTSPSYDYVKYHGKLARPINYEKRNDKLQIQKIAKHKDAFGLMVANLLENPKAWTGDIVSDIGIKNYMGWLKRKESLTYTFTEEIKKLDENFDSNFLVIDSQHPKALRLYLGARISLETLVIIDEIIHFYSNWDTQLKDDLLWKDIRLKIPKYRPFLKIDTRKFSAILKKQFTGK